MQHLAIAECRSSSYFSTVYNYQ